MRREYQITIDFEMGDYDAQQDRDQMTDVVRRIVESYGGEEVHIRFVEGSEAMEP
jgi:histidyl-tRNA synthetase